MVVAKEEAWTMPFDGFRRTNIGRKSLTIFF
jgi:hypothetical protein